jgi:hypothetical protein
MTQSKSSFLIRFSDQQYAPAMRLAVDADPQEVINTFHLLTPRPTLFISGGASGMSEADVIATRNLIEHGVAKFASEHHLTVVDGGTDAGVMGMIGTARRKHGYTFPLIGVAPLHTVRYPGWYTDQPDNALLEDGHSHFVLVDADEWGAESGMIVNLTRAIANRQHPMLGILINGGKIAERDVYLATAKGDNRIPMVVIDGSGRTADTISNAYKTQQTDSHVIRAIINGGHIHIVALADGVDALVAELHKHFVDADHK